MTHTYYHAKSSARVLGGGPDDYLEIHNWFDPTNESFCDFRYRALRHHAEGIFQCERVLGTIVTNSVGKQVPVRYIGEQHVMEDCGGRVPWLADWLSCIDPAPWMAKATQVGHRTRRAQS